jgi:uncharacterized protein YdeI (YjbR/CyaY-like superfamily)
MPINTIPQDLQAALNADQAALTAFESLPPSHQRAYLQWIEDAKQPSTRERRIRGTIGRLMNLGE